MIMTKTAKPKSAPQTARRPWVAPRVNKIDAGQAELGTRTASDGPFSTS
jgi:hypothetical protein